MTKHITYTTQGVCSRKIDIDIDTETNIILQVQFTGGCNGNTQGVAALARGLKVEDAIAKIKGIKCGMKSTSCPDQLALALEEALV